MVHSSNLVDSCLLLIVEHTIEGNAANTPLQTITLADLLQICDLRDPYYILLYFVSPSQIPRSNNMSDKFAEVIIILYIKIISKLKISFSIRQLQFYLQKSDNLIQRYQLYPLYPTMHTVIGIFAQQRDHDGRCYNNLAFDYVRAVESTGAIAIIIPSGTPQLEYFLSSCAGFIFPGGTDIDPTLYRQDYL